MRNLMDTVKQKFNILTKFKEIVSKFVRCKKTDNLYSEDKFIGYEAFTVNYQDELKNNNSWKG